MLLERSIDEKTSKHTTMQYPKTVKKRTIALPEIITQVNNGPLDDHFPNTKLVVFHDYFKEYTRGGAVNDNSTTI